MGCACQNQNSQADDFCPDAPQETPDHVAEVTIKQPFQRRALLKAAAVGTTVAALAGRHGFTPFEALADDLSTLQCTANDVRIVGPGQILNEPCNCSGTFSANVQFTVENNASSARGCIQLHLVPVTINGTVFNFPPITLSGTIEGKTTQPMIGTINGYPCGAGLVCFGVDAGDGRGRCGVGTCSTVTWTVPGQGDTCPPDKQIGSKCRHQQICIQGRGRATLVCDAASGSTNCNLACNASGTVRLCTTGGPAPYTFALSDGQSFGPTNDTCHDFTVGPFTQTTNLTGTVTDSGSPVCVYNSNQITLAVTPISLSLAGTGGATCGDGKLNFTATPTPAGAAEYTWSVDNVVKKGPGSDNTFTYDPVGLGFAGDGKNHTVKVVGTRGGGSCADTKSANVRSCVQSDIS